MNALSRLNPLVAVLTGGIGILILIIAIKLSGVRPYGEQAILIQIEHEDSALCDKFGLNKGTQAFANCLLDLADLRRKHIDLLVAYSWL